ncbi:MAG: hypothetical protein INF43_01505, partial [Alphaproteobacteria bacterium]|nr:hypothetical protein [Alphaproteobacteria bacterium]
TGDDTAKQNAAKTAARSTGTAGNNLANNLAQLRTLCATSVPLQALASSLGVSASNLDERIADEARAGNLSQAQIERLKRVGLGDSQGIGIALSTDAAENRVAEAANRLGITPGHLDQRIADQARAGTLTPELTERLRTGAPLGSATAGTEIGRILESDSGIQAGQRRVDEVARRLEIAPNELDSRIAQQARAGTLSEAQLSRLDKVDLGDRNGVGIALSNEAGDRRVAAVAEQLEITPGQLDQRIANAARAGTLTQAQRNSLGELELGDGPGIGRVLGQPAPGREPPPTTQPRPGGDTTTQPNGRNNTPDGGLANMMRGMGGGQQPGGGGSPLGNQSNNPFNNQFGQQGTCPVGTQLSYFNGQQACINTGQTNNTCPAGYTAAYAPNNNSLAGYGGNQVICVATGTTGGTCPNGQVASLQSNGTTICVTQTATTDEAKLRDQAGYLDGVRVKDGVCGLGIDSRFSSDSNYLAGYNRGQAECRTATATTSTTTVRYDVSDARARAICGDQIGNVSKDAKDEKSLFILLFRERGTLSETERKALGFDETIYKRLVVAKTQFDAGKTDAVSVRDLDPDRKENVSYREGYACGRKMIESKQ